MKYNPIFEGREDAISNGFDMVELPNNERRRLSKEEKENPSSLIEGSKLFMSVTFTKPGPGSNYEVEYKGKTFNSGKRWWGVPCG